LTSLQMSSLFRSLVVAALVVVALPTSAAARDMHQARALSEAANASGARVGHEPDPGLGYYHFGRRVYDPTLRRWLSPDPLIFGAPEVDAADGRQLNLYAYAANNPVSATDTTGMYVESGVDAVSLAVGVNSIRNWNEKTSFWTKVADVGGVVLDGAALALPAI